MTTFVLLSTNLLRRIRRTRKSLLAFGAGRLCSGAVGINVTLCSRERTGVVGDSVGKTVCSDKGDALWHVHDGGKETIC